MNKVKNKNYLYMFIVALAVFLIVFAGDKIGFVFNVLKPVFAGIVIAYLLDGMVRFLNRRLKMKRGFAIVVVIVAVLAVMALCVYYALPLLVNTTKDLIDYIISLLAGHDNGLYNMVDTVASMVNFDLSSFDIKQIDSTIINALNSFVQRFSGAFVNSIVAVGSSLVNILTSVIMAIYMLVEKDSLLKWIKRLVKASFSESRGNYILNAFSMANSVFKKFIIGKFIDSSIIGVLCYVLFKIFGIEYAAVFSIITGVGNMIPYFGPIFSAIPVVLILLIINPQHALIALIIIIVVQQLDGNVIGPKILSDNIGVSAFWILFAVTVCGMAFGFAGMIVGVPLVVVIKNLIEDFVEMRLKQREKPEDTAEASNISEELEVVGENAEKQ